MVKIIQETPAASCLRGQNRPLKYRFLYLAVAAAAVKTLFADASTHFRIKQAKLTLVIRRHSVVVMSKCLVTNCLLNKTFIYS